MTLWNKIAEQFGKPSGILGKLVGLIMASRSSNIERSEWGVSVLNIEPTDHVLEIGFGPGVAIEMMSKLVTDGIIYGIDHSRLMLEQANRRNEDAILSGKVKLMQASTSRLPNLGKPLDKVITINSIMFWGDPVSSLKELRKIMKKGATIAIVHQPRKPGSTADDTFNMGKKISNYLTGAGFINVKVETNEMKPVLAICILAEA